VATTGAPATLATQLAALKELGRAASAGAGTKGAPLVWRAVDAPPATPPPPTSDPAYVCYLNSKAWGAKRSAILDRAARDCEACGDALEAGEAEVHHLTYARVFRELPEDLIALCPGCHRRAHA
jgi:HNH endonuclease